MAANGASSPTSGRTILLPVDASEHSERAFSFFVKNVHRENDNLVLIHVVEPIAAVSSYGLAAQTPAFVEELSRELANAEKQGKALGKKYIQMCKAYSVKYRFMLHIGCKVGDHILHYIKENRVDMILMGSRGMGKLRRTFLGSVSDHVLHHAHVPMCIVPPGKDE